MALILGDDVVPGLTQQNKTKTPAPSQPGSTADLYGGMGDYGPPVAPPSAPDYVPAPYVPPEPTYSEVWDNAFGGYRRIYSDGRPDEILKGSDSTGWTVYTEDQLLAQAPGIGDYGEYVAPAGLATPPAPPPWEDTYFEKPQPLPPAPLVIENQVTSNILPWAPDPTMQNPDTQVPYQSVDMTPSSLQTPNITQGNWTWDSTLQTWVDNTGGYIWNPILNKPQTRTQYLDFITKGSDAERTPWQKLQDNPLFSSLDLSPTKIPDWADVAGPDSLFNSDKTFADSVGAHNQRREDAYGQNPEWNDWAGYLSDTINGQTAGPKIDTGIYDLNFPGSRVEDLPPVTREDIKIFPDLYRLRDSAPVVGGTIRPAAVPEGAPVDLYDRALASNFEAYGVNPGEAKYVFSGIDPTLVGLPASAAQNAWYAVFPNGVRVLIKDALEGVSGVVDLGRELVHSYISNEQSEALASRIVELIQFISLTSPAGNISPMFAGVQAALATEYGRKNTEEVLARSIRNNASVLGAAGMVVGGVPANIAAETAFAATEVLLEKANFIPKPVRETLAVAAAIGAGWKTGEVGSISRVLPDAVKPVSRTSTLIDGLTVRGGEVMPTSPIRELETILRIKNRTIEEAITTPDFSYIGRAPVDNWKVPTPTSTLDVGTVVRLTDGSNGPRIGVIEQITPEGLWRARSGTGAFEFTPDEVVKYIDAPTRDELTKAATWTPEELLRQTQINKEVVIDNPAARGEIGNVEYVSGNGIAVIRQPDGTARFANMSDLRPLSEEPKKGDAVFFNLGSDFDGGTVVKVTKNTVSVNVGDRVISVPRENVQTLIPAEAKVKVGKAGKAGKKVATATGGSKSSKPLALRAPDSPWDEGDIRVLRKTISAFDSHDGSVITFKPEDRVSIARLLSNDAWDEDDIRLANSVARRYARPLETVDPGLADELSAVSRPIASIKEDVAVPPTWSISNNTTGQLGAGEVVFARRSGEYYRVMKPVNSDSPQVMVDVSHLTGLRSAPVRRRDLVSVMENGKRVSGDIKGPEDLVQNMQRVRIGDSGTPMGGKLEQAAYRNFGQPPSAVGKKGVGVENLNRVDLNLPFQRGKEAVLNRIDLELKLGKVDPDLILAKRFLEGMDEKYLDNVAISFLKGENVDKSVTDMNIVGQYLPMETIIRIAKEGGDAHTVIHEAFHHFSRFVPMDEKMALLRQWRKQLDSEGSVELAGIADLLDLSWKRSELYRMTNNMSFSKRLERATELGDDWVRALTKIETPEEVARIDAAYRWRGGFAEWFSEVMTDKALRDQVAAQSAETRNFIQTVGYHISNLMHGVVDFLRRTGRNDAAERVYKALRNGEYSDFGKVMDDARGPVDEEGYIYALRRQAKVAGSAVWRGAVQLPPIRIRSTFNGKVGGPWLELPGKQTIKDMTTLMTTVRQGRRTINSAMQTINGQAKIHINNLGGLTQETVDISGKKMKAWVVKGVAANAEDAKVGLRHPMLRDLVQETSSYNLTPAQKDAVTGLQGLMETVHATAKSFGVDPAELKIADLEGGFWPDRARAIKFGEVRSFVKREYDEVMGRSAPTTEIAQVPGGSSHLSRYNTTGRFHYSARSGLANGVTYDNPIQVLDSHVREALTNSLNSYTAAVAKQFGVYRGQGVPSGFTHLEKDAAPLLKNYTFEGRTTPIGRFLRPGDAERLNKMFNNQSLSRFDRPLALVQDVSNFVKSFTTTLDASSTYQQLFMANATSPHRLGKMAVMSLQMLVPQSQQKLWDDMISDPRFTDFVLAGGEVLGEAGDAPEFVFSRALEHIPWGPGATVRHFNDHYTRFITYSRFQMYKDFIDAEEMLGRTVSFESKVMKARAINMATGSAQKWDPSAAEKIMLFAPSYYRSHAETIAFALADWKTETGAIARRMVANFIGTTTMTAASVALIQGRDLKEVMLPLTVDEDGTWRWNSNFMTIRVAGIDIPVAGPYTAYLRFFTLLSIAGQAAQSKGEFDGFLDTIVNMYRQKSSPASAFLIDLLKQETYSGEPLNYLKWEQTAERIVPFSISAFMREYRENGDWKEAVITSALNFFGLNNNPMTAWEKFNSKLLGDTDLWDDDMLIHPGLKPEYHNLNPQGKKIAREKYGDPPKTTNKDSLKRIADAEANAENYRLQIETLTEWVQNGDKSFEEVRPMMKSARDKLHAINEYIYRESNPDSDKATDIYSQYYNFVDSTDVGFGPDWNAVEAWIAALPETKRKQLTTYLDNQSKTSRETKVGVDALYYQTLDKAADLGLYEVRDKAWAEYVEAHPELKGYNSIDAYVQAERKKQFDAAMEGKPLDSLEDKGGLLKIIEDGITDSDLFKGWITYWKGGVVDGDEVNGQFDVWFAGLDSDAQKAIGVASAFGLVGLADDQRDTAWADLLGKTEEEKAQMRKELGITIEQNELTKTVNTILAEHGYSKESIDATAFKNVGVDGWDSLSEMELSYKKNKAIDLGLAEADSINAAMSVDELNSVVGKPGKEALNTKWSDLKGRKTAEVVNGVSYPGLTKFNDEKEELEISNVLAIANHSSPKLLAQAILSGAVSLSNLREASLVEVAYALSGSYSNIPDPAKVSSSEMKAYVAKLAKEVVSQ